jgi:multidrug efflux pump subunit AcrA (membrane-fusion protein)
MKNRALTFTILVVVVIVALAVYRFVSVRSKKVLGVAESAQAVAVGVEVVPVLRQPIEDLIEATGSLAPQAQILLYSKVPGKLSRNLVEMNQRVEKDQVVALVDRDEVGVEFAPAEVKTPIAGVVAQTFLDPGALVAPQIPVAQIVSIGQVKAEVNVVERDIGRIQVGQPATVRVDAYDQDFPGLVTNISPVVNPQLRSVEVEVTVPNSSRRLKPGMFARAAIRSGRHEGLVIPSNAVVRREGKALVYVVGSELVVKERAVGLGQDLGQTVEVKQGLSAGERVVTTGAYGLKDGTRVNVGNHGTGGSGGGQ